MEKILRIALGQINCTVGDLNGNQNKIIDYIGKAHALGVNIICFPELAITGYPPEDLLLKPKFIDDNLQVMEHISRLVSDIVVVVGFVNRIDERLYNAASVMYEGLVHGIYHKAILPNYGVFDEKRYFKAGGEPVIFAYGALKFGTNICEDIWFKEGPTRLQAMAGAALIISINASPFHAGKGHMREEIIKNQARDNGLFIVYTNMVGGQDELVFDGGSMVVDRKGNIIARASQFKEELLLVDIPFESIIDESQKPGIKNTQWSPRIITLTNEIPRKIKIPLPSPAPETTLEPYAEIYDALILGLHDYVHKNGFRKVVIGLSGGIDSALVATIACDALGKENVVGVFMPSLYTSEESRIDVQGLAKNLQIELIEVSIDSIFTTYLSSLSGVFKDMKADITEENIQARIRGNILMALSNKFGWLVLTTGNKSEMSVGYATLYGDMAGGFAVIKDVPKTMVYEIARYRNSKSATIPERVFIKEPTAELKPQQKDSDTLPPYGILDPILKAYVEEDKTIEEIGQGNIEKDIVEHVLRMVDVSEYKRRQSPPGIKITPKAFGRDRRMPITNKYRR
ncbi:MAG TPA: NAD+ synthase [Deltaproteobacteria bacterium]|nr:NAD+ synthase [Deltaproteobacteria bacterium]